MGKKQKTKTHVHVAYKKLTSDRKTHRLKVKGWKKIFHENRKEKKTGVALLISEKIDFKTKTVTRDTKGHYIMIKESSQQEDITLVNI